MYKIKVLKEEIKYDDETNSSFIFEEINLYLDQISIIKATPSDKKHMYYARKKIEIF